MFFKASKAFLECQHSHLPLEALSDELRTSASNQVTSEWHQLNINHGGCTNRCDKTMLWLKCEILIHINSPKDYPFKSIQLKKKTEEPIEHIEMTEVFTLKSCPVESSSWKIKQQNVNYEVSIIPVWRITHSFLRADGKAVVTCCCYTLLYYWKVQPGCYLFL